MELLKQKVWKLPLIVWFILTIALTSIVAGAIVYTLTLSGRVTITEVAGNFSFKAYSDAQATIEMTSFDLGEASAGEYPVSLTFYIRNTGDATITKFNVYANPSTVVFPANLQLPTDLQPDSIGKTTINFKISDNPPIGLHEFELIIEAVA